MPDNEFTKWFYDHEAELLVMECEDIARIAFFAGMKAAQQSVHLTGGTCRICGKPESAHTRYGHRFNGIPASK